MKELVAHFIKDNFKEIVDNSLLNCHARGLHSIMFSNVPGKVIRLFICVPDNDMYLNLPALNVNNMSVGFHAHHCDLTLHCIEGRFLNWEVEQSGCKENFMIDSWLHKSKIKTGEMHFERKGVGHLRNKDFRWVNKNETVFMRADELHTVACYSDELTAWFVYEGKESPTPNNLMYSRADLNKIDSSQLYQKPTMKQVAKLLNMVELLPDDFNYLLPPF